MDWRWFSPTRKLENYHGLQRLCSLGRVLADKVCASKASRDALRGRHRDGIMRTAARHRPLLALEKRFTQRSFKITIFQKEFMTAKPTMIECPSCKHQVSTSAMSCPSCGAVLRKPKRGFFDKLVIFAFWGFNILMIVWILVGTQSAVETQAGLSGAEAVGAAIGTGIGVTLVIFIWLIGAIILGLMALIGWKVNRTGFALAANPISIT